MPVWDDFLSENDKKMLANRKPMRPKPHAQFGERPAILVIDMNKSAIGPDLPVHEIVNEMPGAMGENAWAAIRHMEDLLPMARGGRHPRRVQQALLQSQHGPRPVRPRKPLQRA